MLNSLISGEIIEAFTHEGDIEISYPTTTIIPKERDLGVDLQVDSRLGMKLKGANRILADGKIPQDSTNQDSGINPHDSGI